MKTPSLPIIEMKFTAEGDPLSENPGLRPFYMGIHTPGVVLPELSLLHFHKGLELGAVLSGKGIVCLEGREYPVATDDVFFFDSMLTHHTAGESLCEIIVHMTVESVINAHIDEGDLRLLNPFIAVRSHVPPVLKNCPEIKLILKDAVEVFRSDDPFGKLRAWHKTGAALVEISRKVSSTMTDRLGNEWMGRNRTVMLAVEHIHGNFQQPVSLHDLAAVLSVSPSRLSHLFKEHVGVSPIDYRNQLRVAHALEKITTSDQKLTSIALECGFRSMAQFHAFMKKATGKTPASLRNGK